VLAIGREAMQMHEKTHENIKTIRPLKEGVIADFHAAEMMIRGLIKMIDTGKRLFPPSLRNGDLYPLRDYGGRETGRARLCEHANAKEVYMIHEPIAAAIGIGMILNSLWKYDCRYWRRYYRYRSNALSGIVMRPIIRIAGILQQGYLDYMRNGSTTFFNGERTAERVKIEVGSALTELE